MIAVVGVLIAARDLIRALTNQLAHMVLNVCGASRIGYGGNQPLSHSDTTVNFPEKQNPRIGTYTRVIKKGGNFLATKGCKFKLKCGNISHEWISSFFELTHCATMS